MLDSLSDYLTEEYGRGLIVQSPIGQLTVDHQSFPFKLSWTHYQVLMAIEDPAERIDFISDEIKKSPSAILDNLKEKIAKKKSTPGAKDSKRQGAYSHSGTQLLSVTS